MEIVRRFEAAARAALPEAVHGYFAGGAGDEQTLADNLAAWRDLWLVPRQLRGVPAADPATTLLGTRCAAPVVLAPAAAQRLLHPDGEVAVARAAAAAGLVFTLSTRATADLAEVAEAAPDAPRWFQLYVSEDRGLAAAQLRRAAAHGYRAVVLTVDLPVAGRREREREPVPLPEGVAVVDHLGGEGPCAGGGGAAEDPSGTKPPVGGWATLTWDDVGWAAGESGLPVLVKGVLCAEDAERALDAGAAGVVVSNHGGRQLDGCVPTAVALPGVADAVAGRAAVLVDGGVRSGTDVVRALALGADAVLVGRPYLWALAAGGQAAVADLLTALVDDVARTLLLAGAAGPAEIGPRHVKARRA